MLYSEAQELYTALEFTLSRNEELECQNAEETYYRLTEVGYLIEGYDTSIAIESAMDTIKNTFKKIQQAFHTALVKFEVFIRSFIRKHRQKKSRRLINDLYGVTILISKEEVDRLEKVFDNLDIKDSMVTITRRNPMRDLRKMICAKFLYSRSHIIFRISLRMLSILMKLW